MISGNVKKVIGLLAVVILGVSFINQANAIGQGDWLLRFGAASVNPNDKSSLPGLGVEDAQAIFVNGTYMLSDNIGLELLASTPFTHDITLAGSGKIAETKHLPPTFSVQYHFSPKQSFRPYVGAGINYTTFFSEKATAVINSISLDDSLGLAVQAGFDVDINKDWFFNADIRYIDIETTASTNIGDIEVTIDPTVISLGVGTRF